VKASEAWSPDELLNRARAGEAAAFAALVRRYQRPVFSIALRMLGDRHRAEDLAQEVFLQLYRSLDGIGSDAHLAFWLRKVAVNRAIDRIRQEARYDNEPLTEAASVV
jgi:RNA polymerase sigma-70 factor (ECF subfamily)